MSESGNPGTLINPHNPEFLTKKPWYLSDGTVAGPTLDHQTDQRPDKQKLVLSLTTSEQLLHEHRLRQQKERKGSTSFKVGQWVEALKKNRLPYRICEVIGVHNNGREVDLKYEDGTIDRKVKTSRNSSSARPTVRFTKTGNRALELSGSDAFKESYDGKRDLYHGYDRDTYNSKINAKYQKRQELRKQIRREKLEEARRNAESNTNSNGDESDDGATGGGVGDKDGDKKDSNQQNASHNGRSTKSNVSSNRGKGGGGSDSDFDDSDLDSDAGSDNDSDDEKEFVQRDEDAKVITSRLARQGGVGGAQMKVTARNLRIREDTAKYLRNLDIDSAYYDPKSRSMRDNPTPHIPVSETDYAGDNFVRITGDAAALAKTQLFAWDPKAVSAVASNTTDAASSTARTALANDEGGLHPQANPSQAELLHKKYQTVTIQTKLQQKQAVLNKYGGEEYLDGSDGLASAVAPLKQQSPKDGSNTITSSKTNAATTTIDRTLRFGVSTQQERYTVDKNTGRLVKFDLVGDGDTSNGKKTTKVHRQRQPIPCKYELDVHVNGHTAVWGSYFHKGAFFWGYADDHSLLRHSYGTGLAGREVNDEANLLKYGTGVAGSAQLAQARKTLAALTNNAATSATQTEVSESTKSSTTDPAKIRQELRRQQLEGIDFNEDDDNTQKYAKRVRIDSNM